MGDSTSQLSKNHLITDPTKISSFSRGEANQLAPIVFSLNDYQNYHLQKYASIFGLCSESVKNEFYLLE